MGLREKNRALPASSATTLMLVSSTASTGEWIGAIKLAAKNPSRESGTTASTRAGSSRGSSPLTQTYRSAFRDWAASYTRWVLVGHWGEVILQGIWYSPQAWRMASWSVATHTSARRLAFFT